MADDLQDIAQRSEVIAVLTILEGRPSRIPIQGCGWEYEAKVIQGIKGDKSTGDTLSLRLWTGLTIGQNYLVFGDLDEWPGKVFLPKYLDIVDIRSSACSSLNGQLTATQLVVSGKKSYVDGLLEEYWIQDSSDSREFVRYFVGPIEFETILSGHEVGRYPFDLGIQAEGTKVRKAFDAGQLLRAIDRVVK